MYIILLSIIFIISIEIFNYIKYFNMGFLFKNKNIEKSRDFEEYISNSSFEKNFNAGKLYTDETYNLFIIKNNDITLVKKGTVYDIIEPFILKYININEKMIKYYYK